MNLDKNQLNFCTEPLNDIFFCSFSRKKKKKNSQNDLSDTWLHFLDLCKTIFDKLSEFCRSKPGKDEKSKNYQKNSKTSSKCRKQLQKLLYIFVDKNLVKKFSNSEIEEKRKKFSEIISHQRVLLDSQNAAETTLPWFFKKNLNSFTRSAKVLRKNMIIPEKIHSIISAEHVKCRFYNPAKNLSSPVRKELLKMRKKDEKFPNEFFDQSCFSGQSEWNFDRSAEVFPKVQKNFSLTILKKNCTSDKHVSNFSPKS